MLDGKHPYMQLQHEQNVNYIVGGQGLTLWRLTTTLVVVPHR